MVSPWNNGPPESPKHTPAVILRNRSGNASLAGMAVTSRQLRTPSKTVIALGDAALPVMTRSPLMAECGAARSITPRYCFAQERRNEGAVQRRCWCAKHTAGGQAPRGTQACRRLPFLASRCLSLRSSSCSSSPASVRRCPCPFPRLTRGRPYRAHARGPSHRGWRRTRDALEAQDGRRASPRRRCGCGRQ
jgi:hypothetical protein